MFQNYATKETTSIQKKKRYKKREEGKKKKIAMRPWVGSNHQPFG